MRLSRPIVQPEGDVFAAVDAGEADLGIHGKVFYAAKTTKGTAALAALRQAAKDNNFANLLLEEDESAAFPVRVDLQYVAQDRTPGTVPESSVSLCGSLPPLFFLYHSIVASRGAVPSALSDTTFFARAS